jgi:hypothetical protein
MKETTAAMRGSLSIAIMTHPARLTSAEKLAARLGAAVSIAIDPDPDAPTNSARTAALAWSMVSKDASHHVVLQDDAEPCDGFVDALLNAISVKPESALSLFVEWGHFTASSVRLAALCNASWVPVLGRTIAGVGVCLPHRHAVAFSEYLRERYAAEGRDSILLRDYLRASNVAALATVPSLVDHDRPYSLSLWRTARIKGLRRAAYFQSSSPSFTGHVLPAVDWLPILACISRYDLDSRILLQPNEHLQWKSKPTTSFFEELNLTENILINAFEDHFDSTVQRPVGFGDGVAFEIWKTAVALGLLWRQSGGHSLNAVSVDQWTAVASMAPGALRCTLPPQQLVSLDSELRDFVRRAVNWGAHVGKA